MDQPKEDDVMETDGTIESLIYPPKMIVYPLTNPITCREVSCETFWWRLTQDKRWEQLPQFLRTTIPELLTYEESKDFFASQKRSIRMTPTVENLLVEMMKDAHRWAG